MHHNILILLALLSAMLMLYMLSQKLRVSYPIFLVIGGLIIGLLPGMPRLELHPDIVFLIFLPPLLYEAAWFTSWRNFWRWKRSILSLAVGLVILTSIAVAFVSTALIPGFTLALGFLLGGIVSPPDAVAASSVLKEIKVPRRITTILEGESLINDASSLIVFRFATAAVLTGHFVLSSAVVNFFAVALLGIAVGIALGIVIYCIHKFLPTTASVDTLLTIIAPYVMYLTAEQFHFSGVLAVVSGGLFLSNRSHELFDYKSRMQAYSVWASFSFLLNGLVFILIGLELPVILDGLGEYSIREAIFYGIIISLTAVIVRILYIFPNAYLPRFFSKKIRERERCPSIKVVFLVGWAGMRGVVSLASALAVPLALPTGEEFPHRNLILFITFIVIFITLVFQGLSMPFLIRLLNVEEVDEYTPESVQLSQIRSRIAQISLMYLDQNYPSEVTQNDKLHRFYEQLRHTVRREKELISNDGEPEERTEARRFFNKIFLELLDIRRKALSDIRHEKIYDDEVLFEYERLLDLEEARMQI